MKDIFRCSINSKTAQTKFRFREMQYIALLIFLPICLLAQQEWAPIGAKWYQNTDFNDFDEQHHPLEGFYLIESTGDTIIDGLSYRIVGDYLMYQEGFEVYFLWKDSLRLLYDFDVQEGDTIKFEFLNCLDSIIKPTYKVIETSELYLNQQVLKKVKCQLLFTSDYGGPSEYEYIEKIGSTTKIVEESGDCVAIPEYSPEWLRCYADSTIEYKSDRFLSFGDNDCTFMGTLDKLDEKHKEEGIIIFPNPFHEGFTIKGKGSMEVVELFDLRGKLLYKQYQEKGLNKVVISPPPLTKGVYILAVEMKGGRKIFRKVIQR
ncbi:MAG: T9SS type A sorting domain-containing protein [Bacteroidetes bacterium]|nr:T9SS type A sorting domain-containing protein [Bacteroidota bacterium]